MKKIAKILFRMLLLAIFLMCCLFWIVVSFYTVRGFVTGGIAGVKQWLLHIDQGHSDPLIYVPHWNLILLRIAAIAVLTFLLWLANRRVIKELLEARRGPKSST